MPDPSRLVEYAQQHGCAWRWKMERVGDKWRAIAMLKPDDGDHSPVFSSGLMDTEQAALDKAIGHAIDYRVWRVSVKHGGSK